MLVIALQLYEINQIGDLQASRSQFETIDFMERRLTDQYSLLQKSQLRPALKPAVQEYLAVLGKAKQASDRSLELSKAGDFAASSAFIRDQSRPYGLQAAQMQGKLTALFNQEIEKSHEETAAAYKRMRAWMLAGLLAGSLLCGAATLLTMRSIGSSLGAMQDALHVANQTLDLNQRVPVHRPDEIGRTAAAFNSLIGRVEAAIRGVRGSTDSVHVAAREIAAGNADLSRRTEQQAGELERAVARMSELNCAVAANARNVEEASTLARKARALADASNTAVDAMVKTNGEISEGAKQIAEITSVIEGIAFQTNILALNAAVEAARAGEQGRGFAVVANEVRDLAQRSSTAAKEIKVLIDTSVAMVQQGSQEAAAAGSSMTQLQAAIQSTFSMFEEIAVASRQQSAGLADISSAMAQLDSMTQQNAALVEEAAGAASLLEDQATQLHRIVGEFKIDQPAAQLSAQRASRYAIAFN